MGVIVARGARATSRAIAGRRKGRISRARERRRPRRVRDAGEINPRGVSTVVDAAPAPPDGYAEFAITRSISLGVRDAPTVSRSSVTSTSVRAWLEDPVNFVGVVFGVADVTEVAKESERGGRAFLVRVRPRELFKWEISPEFAIEAVRASGDGGARLIGDELRFGGDRARLPPGFRSMGVWARIDAVVSVDEENSTEDETTVRTEVNVRVAAEIPRLLRAIPGFSSAATMTIGRSIDIVGGSIEEATQATYDAWAAKRASEAD
ncbi:unnamed product [Ostreococcus tauri]|uniref:Unnamed product n=1 Tax=Ostreococcus tauri TaxID=70448 RepID=A0A090N3J6_OSTTA|nr:unnamed product [Ostreococcus tauri]CEF98233.1 unnamed product [Ostreococcus tauri]|eukprot:XP_022839152.1 unnamed product [Ostreococcus tauri]